MPAHDPRHPRPPTQEQPSLLERLGCFVFVALPLVAGLPVIRAWALVLGDWFLAAYSVGSLLLLFFVIYVLEREEEEA